MQPEMYEQYQAQSQLQSEAGDQQVAPYGPAIQEQVAQTQAVLIQQTNPDKILHEIILRLKGLREEPNGSLIREGPPLMNAMGVAQMKFVLSGFLNQNTTLSHLDEREITKLVLYMHENIVRDLAIKWRDYKVRDRATLNHIEASIVVPALLALKRALGQNEKNWLGKITVENISGRQSFGMPKKEGFFSKFKL